MTKITIELEDGTIREINASSYALNAISLEGDRLLTYANAEDTEDNREFLAASLLVSFTDLSNRMYENMGRGEMTEAEFIGKLTEIADKLLKMGGEDA